MRKTVTIALTVAAILAPIASAALTSAEKAQLEQILKGASSVVVQARLRTFLLAHQNSALDVMAFVASTDPARAAATAATITAVDPGQAVAVAYVAVQAAKASGKPFDVASFASTLTQSLLALPNGAGLVSNSLKGATKAEPTAAGAIAKAATTVALNSGKKEAVKDLVQAITEAAPGQSNNVKQGAQEGVNNSNASSDDKNAATSGVNQGSAGADLSGKVDLPSSADNALKDITPTRGNGNG